MIGYRFDRDKPEIQTAFTEVVLRCRGVCVVLCLSCYVCLDLDLSCLEEACNPIPDLAVVQ